VIVSAGTLGEHHYSVTFAREGTLKLSNQRGRGFYQRDFAGFVSNAQQTFSENQRYNIFQLVVLSIPTRNVHHERRQNPGQRRRRWHSADARASQWGPHYE